MKYIGALVIRYGLLIREAERHRVGKTLVSHAPFYVRSVLDVISCWAWGSAVIVVKQQHF